MRIDSFSAVTVSGLPGSGTSTLCSELRIRLEWEHLNTGDVFRQLAEQRGISLAEFGRQAETNAAIDTELDERVIRVARMANGIILEGRVAGWMAMRHDLPAYRVWVAAPQEVRAERVAEREGKVLEVATEEMIVREGSEASRYEALYKIDIADVSIYHLVIDSGSHDPMDCADQVQTGMGSARHSHGS